MGNTFPAASSRALSLTPVRTGEPVRSRDVKPLLELHNSALAEAATGTVIQQSWPRDQCSHTGAIPTVAAEDVPIAEWAIPLVSDAHLALEVEVRAYAEVAATGGTVTLRSVGGADEISAAVGLGAAAADTWTDVGTLDLAAAAVVDGHDVEFVQLFIETDATPGDIVVEQIHGEIAALTSPLGTDRIDDVEPVDPTSADEDEALASALGVVLAEGDAVLRPRPHLGITWSGLSSAYTGPGADDELPVVDELAAMRDHREHRLVVMVRRPATESGRITVPPLAQRVPDGDAGDLTWYQFTSDAYPAGDLRPADPSLSTVGAFHDDSAGGIAGLTIWSRSSSVTGDVDVDVDVDEGLPRTPPLVPSVESMGWARPVLPEQIDALGDSALHHAWVRAVRRVTHTATYTAATRATDPTNLNHTWRTVWTTSQVASAALVAVRYQSGSAGKVAPVYALDVELRDRDDGDAVLDSFTVDAADLELSLDPPVWWLSPIDDEDGGPRPLASPGGRRVELVIAGADVRVLSVTVIELVPDALETPVET